MKQRDSAQYLNQPHAGLLHAASTQADDAELQRNASARVSCVVPCLNEQANLRLLLPLLGEVLSATSFEWEVIVVDDGSTDETPDLMRYWSGLPGFRYLQLSRNFGKEAALSAGLEAAVGDVVICLDADMQHPPQLIPELLSRWQAGTDMVYAVREHREDEGLIKRLGSQAFYRLLNPSRGVSIPPDAGDFRLMDRQVVDALLQLPERTRFMKGLYAWVGFKSEAVPYTPAERVHGHSQFRLLRLVRLALAGLTAFTTWPLRLVSVIGITLAIMSILYGLYLIIDYFLHGNTVSGWTTIVTALFFFSGINLISLGIVGEYVARIFDETKGRPLYIIRRQRGTGFKDTQ